MHVLDANPSQAGNFGIGENLLARLHGNHGPSSSTPPQSTLNYFDAACIVAAARNVEQ
jgi:hypothetical protein